MGLFSNTKPPLTEKNLPDQSGKVFIVTGSTGGLGKDLAQMLYAQNAKIYIAARSEQKARQVIDEIKGKFPTSKGALVYLHLDLNDLTTIKASAESFLAQEKSLHVLWNNAGVMRPPQGSVTKQGYELQIGTNNVAPFLFTKLLTPLLKETAKISPPGSVRVVWVSSSAAKNFSPDGGLDVSNLDYHIDKGVWPKYGISKAGNIYHGKEYARRFGQDGILSLSVDPGFLKTDLYQNLPRWQAPFMNLLLHDPIYGAYTELFAGLSTDITMSNNGDFIEPWGKVTPARKDIELGSKPKEEGGTGIAKDFWYWTEKQIATYI
ncbi:putative short-chain dehydrogenase [Cadophora sp. MPI-SDFR-AT-0126]|nr:putative short-chain dehydrogenase [Leotiomycetes sp. MPI-SDFR-AT-0126]